MRKFCALALYCIYLVHSLSAFEIPPFRYGDPASEALGGQTVFGGSGIHALHTNPASFSLSDDVNYTLLSVTPWVLADWGDLGGIGSETNSDEALIDAAGSGYGAGMSFAAGLTGKGVGLGILGGIETEVVDSAGLRGLLNAELSAVVGYAMDLSLGELTLIGGGDIRPLLRIYGTYPESRAFEVGRAVKNPADLFAVLNKVENPYYGSGIGFDLGTQLHYRDFALGASLRDVGGTRITAVQKETAKEAIAEMGSLAVNAGEEEFSELIVPMSFALGLRYRPEFWSSEELVPTLYGEIGDLFAEEAPIETASAGIELAWKERLALRGGYNSGGLSLGLGLDLPILGIDASYYALSGNGTERAQRGFSLEGRLEF